MNIVGKGIKKIDGMSITTGKPVYTDDLSAKDALVVKILRSPHAYAKIKDIDTSKAEMIDGVESPTDEIDRIQKENEDIEVK